MTANEAIKLLLEIEEKIKGNVFKQESIICVVGRAGSDEPLVAAGKINDLIDKDFGPPLHTIVVPGNLHFMEFESLKILAQLPAQ
jgi:diphthine synthase